ncbi:MAG TPA: glycosyltransferase [Bacillota bacterium]|nr:glycosyltransferase [Bacillota bacterium]
MKVAVITCYDQVNYVRAQALRTAFAAAPDCSVVVVKNSQRGLLRYLEVPFKILKTKLVERPDVFVITFRGYEMLPITLLFKGRKPLIFDEFINAGEYLAEHGKLNLESPLGKLFMWWYSGLLKRCRFVLADTQAHAEYSAKLCHLPIDTYRALPVGVAENLFRPDAAKHVLAQDGSFTVFYYGHMVPLQGMQYILDAAVLLKDTHPEVVFSISGGKEKDRQAVAAAVEKGARIAKYVDWTPFDKIPEAAIAADLCLGGPFGNTLQGQFVIAGKSFQFLACAAPVVIGKNKVSNGFVDKQNCLLVPQGNAQALADAIAWASIHRSKLPAIGRAGRALYDERFSMRTISSMVETMVKDLRV